MADHQLATEISAADAVEQRGETFTVVRRGRAIGPAYRSTLGGLGEFLAATPPDSDWEHDLEGLRRFVGAELTTDPQSD
jgi:hypothetical protein